MTQNATEGLMPIPEGSVYWKLSAVDEGGKRPTVLLVHAGVADHTLWDAQVEFLNGEGWSCLRFDMLGYGKSHPSDEYLQTHPRKPHNPADHIESLRHNIIGADANIIIAGLSVGANLALAYTLAHPDHVVGLALFAGGPRGFEGQNHPEEDTLFDKVESLIDLGDVHGAAQMQVRIWGDGPLQDPGRLPDDLATVMLRWNIDICARECSKRGGQALQQVLQEPPPIARLHTVRVPTAIGWGTMDETFSTESMRYVAGKIKGAMSREFETAHMINLEQPEAFNEFLHEWLEAHFDPEQ